MTFKKRGPGCPCECGETPCNERCQYKCIGAICNPICNIEISMPTPDTVGSTDDDITCPEDDPSCPNSAPCYACIEIFNGHVYSGPPVEQDCNNWTTGAVILTDYVSPNGRFGFNTPTVSCWYPTHYDCPYVNSDLTDCNNAKYVISTINFDGTTLEMVTLSGTWDGECGEVTVVVRYTVEHVKCQQTIPIPDPCDNSGVNPKTKYEHTFKLEYCTCEELHNNFTYVGVTSENNCRGETVPDPCNFESATVKIPQTCINWCYCYNCEGYDGYIYLNAIGGGFSGTITLAPEVTPSSEFSQGSSYCSWVGQFQPCETLDGLEYTIFVRVFIVCHPCDKYTAYIFIRGDNYFEIGGGRKDSYYAQYKLENFSCGSTDSFQLTSSNADWPEDCNLEDFTFSLS